MTNTKQTSSQSNTMALSSTIRLKRGVRLRSASGRAGLPYVGMESIASWTGTIVGELETRETDLGSVSLFEEGDVCFGKLRPYLAKAFIPSFQGICSSEFLVFQPTRFESRFLLYALLEHRFIERVNGSTYGSKMPRANWDFIGEMEVPLPPVETQRAIADFLDRKTASIDALIQKKEKLIELLDEKRAALINQAVTKGLDPNAPKKDSGIPWIGEIPAHWSITKLRYATSIVSKGTTPTTEGAVFTDEGVRFLKAENIKRDGTVSERPEFFIDRSTDRLLRRSQLKEHDILVVIAGATTGKSGVLRAEALPANTNQAVSFVRLNDPSRADFVNAWLMSSGIQQQVWLLAVQSAQPNLSMENLRSFPCPWPPTNESLEICEWIGRQQQVFGALKNSLERQIRFLVEYRLSTVTAAVCGQAEIES